MFRYATAGESHGKGIAALVEGVPAGFTINTSCIDAELARRQGGYGRGDRQKLEHDRAEILTGLLHGKTIGSPVLLWVPNKDDKIESMPELSAPRPGHADLAGSVKYRSGIRPILERASARETAGRVAAGAFAALLLKEFQIEIVGYVLSVGSVSLAPQCDRELFLPETIRSLRAKSSFYSLAPERDAEAETLVDDARRQGDSLGGVVEVRVFGLPIGLGSHVEFSRKLDARLAAALLSIQAFKGAEVGLGFESAVRFGSEVHDAIQYAGGRWVRPTNRAGGIEGGISNSAPVVLRAAMKPIPTLRKPLESVDLATRKSTEASAERSDVCAVSAASVVAENVAAFEIAAALFEKLGGDSREEMLERFRILQERS